MAKAAIGSKGWFCCWWCSAYCRPDCLCGFCVWSLLCYSILCALCSSSFAIILMGKREVVAFLKLVFLMSCDSKRPVAFPHGDMG